MPQVLYLNSHFIFNHQCDRLVQFRATAFSPGRSLYKMRKIMENVKGMNIKLGVYCSNKPDKKFLLYEAQ